MTVEQVVEKWNTCFIQCFPEVLNNTFCVQTPSGGYHYYFKESQASGNLLKELKRTSFQTTGLFDFIDIRHGKAGYVVAPESTIGNNKYEIINDTEVQEVPIYFLKKLWGDKLPVKEEGKKLQKEFALYDGCDVEQNILKLINGEFVDDYSYARNLCWALATKEYRDLAHEILSKSDKYDKTWVDEMYDKYKPSSGITIGTAYHYAKQSNFEEYQKLIPNKKDLVEDKDQEATEVFTDVDSAIQFCKLNSNTLKRSFDGRIWIKLPEGIWSEIDTQSDGDKRGIQELKELITTTPLKRWDFTNDRYYRVNEKLSCINTILALYASKVEKDFKFYEKVRQSNLHCLVFDDGIYDFKEQQFFEHGQYPKDIYPINTIHKKFNDQVSEQDLQYIDKIFFQKIFGQYSEEFKTFIARGLAGEINDKHWIQIRGERNSGKSKLFRFVSLSFENYVGWSSWGNFTVTENGDDNAKKLGWLVDFENKKLMILSELDSGDQRSINGNMIKKVTGGDGIEARKMRKDCRTIYNSARLIGLVNDVPKVKPVDALESSIYFDLPHVFTENPTKFYQKAIIPEIDDIINNPHYQLALIKLLINSYIPEKPVISNDLKQEGVDITIDQKTFESLFDQHYEITKDDNDMLKSSQITTFFKEELGYTAQKTNKILKNQKGLQLKKTARSQFWVRLKEKENEIDEHLINYEE